MPSARFSGEVQKAEVTLPRDRSDTHAADDRSTDDGEEQRMRDLLRRLVIADPSTTREIVSGTRPSGLDSRTEVLVRLAAVAVISGHEGPALEAAREACCAAGASDAVVSAVIGSVSTPTRSDEGPDRVCP